MTCQPFRSVYLGKPGAMFRLPSFDGGISAPLRAGEQAHGLADDGVAVTRVARIRRSYDLQRSAATPDDADLLLAFYAGVFGPAPFCLIEPSYRNFLTIDASSGCSRLGSLNPWTVSAGTLLPDATVTRPLPTAGVMRWVGAGSGSTATLGPVVGDVDPLTAMPVLAAETVTLGIRARTASGTASVTLRLLGRAGDGTATGPAITAAPVTLTTAWQLLTVTAHPGDITALYYGAQLLCSTAGAPDILMAAPQLEATDGVGAFTLGFGVPRVVITTGVARSLRLLGSNTDHSFQLSEV